jgi:hypothetical protein
MQARKIMVPSHKFATIVDATQGDTVWDATMLSIHLSTLVPLIWRPAILALPILTSLTAAVTADWLKAPADAEKVEIERAIKELITKDPSRAVEVEKAIEDVNEPASRRGQRGSRRERARRIVNGFKTFDYPAAGAVLKGQDRGSAKAWCSGTLVGCDKFLTAAHCILEDPRSESYKVFFQEAGFFDVRDIKSVQQHQGQKDPTGDIAVLTLVRPVPHVAPISINRIATPARGVEGAIVGFGRTGGVAYDPGIKRVGNIRTASCKESLSDGAFVCWDFDARVNLDDANTCGVDSGGGLYMQEARERIVVGTTIGAWGGDCSKRTHSFDANVFYYSGWLASNGIGDVANLCGTGPSIDTEEHVQGISDALSDSRTEFSYLVDVRANTAQLSVAMNAEDNGENDFDLYLIRGSDADIKKPVCAEDGPGQFGYCEVQNPMPGPWRIFVKRKRGRGDVQVTATQIPK